MKHVIVGAGPAGVIAAETLRKLKPDASITIIGDEKEPPYSRMALPYYLVKQIDEEGTFLRKSDKHFSDLNIEVRQNRVERLDRANKKLQLDDGSEVAYDKLLLATGSRPASPPIPGIDLPGIFSCWTLEDGRNIAQRANPGAKVLLMGAGFIGCIILEALARSGAQLTVVEMGDRMVPRMMTETAGNMIKSWCIDKGVDVHTSTQVTGIVESSGEHRFEVSLGDGKVIEADLIVSATGVRSNIELLEGTGLNADQGILVNEHMQTSDPDIYAAGDVAQALDFSTGTYEVQAIQPTAAEHAQLAGRNMAGLKDALHRGSVNMNVLDTLGLISSSFGLWMGADGGESAELVYPERYRYLSLKFQDDVLVGATSIGMTEHVGVLRGLIQSRIQLGKWKDILMKDPARVMEAYLACTMPLEVNA